MSWRARIRTSLVYFVAVGAGFALAYLVVAFLVFPAGVIPRDVKVPNVAGLTYEEAEQRLAQAGFRTEKGEQRYNSAAPRNTVLEQSPPPGTREGIGQTITLVVSGGQRSVVVPTVSGMSRADAQSTLEQAGFTVGDQQESRSSLPRGEVVGTRPAAGAQVSVPATVTLIVSAGAATTQMPDLVGRDADEARQTLAQLGMRDVSFVFDPGAGGAPHTVVGQSPVAGASVPPGMSVQLRVAGEGRP